MALSPPPALPPTSRPRSGQRRWIAALLLLVLVGLGFYLAFHPLRNLPDIPLPYDRSAILNLSVAPNDNAFVLYQEACRHIPAQPYEDSQIPAWPDVPDTLKTWLADHRPALDLWYEGANRPEALYIAPAALDISTLLPVTQELRSLTRLGQLEAARLQDEGDLESAWRYHRAVLRTSRHSGTHGALLERLVGISLLQSALDPIERWASDPRTCKQLLEQALADAQEVEAMTPPFSENLQIEHHLLDASLGDPDTWSSLPHLGPPNRPAVQFQVFGRTFSWNRSKNHWPVHILQGEPERSRRLLKLAFANWLAYADMPPESLPPVLTSGEFRLFQPDARAPETARAIAPEVLLHKLHQSEYTSALLPFFNGVLPSGSNATPSSLEHDRRNLDRLLNLLLEQIHAREDDSPSSGPPAP